MDPVRRGVHGRRISVFGSPVSEVFCPSSWALVLEVFWLSASALTSVCEVSEVFCRRSWVLVLSIGFLFLFLWIANLNRTVEQLNLILKGLKSIASTNVIVVNCLLIAFILHTFRRMDVFHKRPTIICLCRRLSHSFFSWTMIFNASLNESFSCSKDNTRFSKDSHFSSSSSISFSFLRKEKLTNLVAFE